MRSYLPQISILSLVLASCGSDLSPAAPEQNDDAAVENVIAHEVGRRDAAVDAQVTAHERDASSSTTAPGASPPPPATPSMADAGSSRDAGQSHDAAVPGRDATPASDAGSVIVPVADAGLDMDSLQQHCVDTINRYRATLSLPPYTRAAAKESCVDGEAASDGASGTAHGAFGTCKESAQDECPGWPSKDMLGQTDKCLAQMWAEGPGDFNMGHGHYINMSSTKYKSVACGFHDLGNGKFWATQDFF